MTFDLTIGMVPNFDLPLSATLHTRMLVDIGGDGVADVAQPDTGIQTPSNAIGTGTNGLVGQAADGKYWNNIVDCRGPLTLLTNPVTTDNVAITGMTFSVNVRPSLSYANDYSMNFAGDIQNLQDYPSTATRDNSYNHFSNTPNWTLVIPAGKTARVKFWGNRDDITETRVIEMKLSTDSVWRQAIHNNKNVAYGSAIVFEGLTGTITFNARVRSGMTFGHISIVDVILEDTPPTVSFIRGVAAGSSSARLEVPVPVLTPRQIITNHVADETLEMAFVGVLPGARLVVTVSQMDDNGGSYANPTGYTSSAGLTWAKVAEAKALTSGNCEIWTTVYAGGGNETFVLTWPDSTPGGTEESLQGVGYELNGQESTPGGNSATASNAQPDLPITTTRDNSIVFGVISEWSYADATSRTIRNGATETYYFRTFGLNTGLHFYKIVPTAGPAGNFGYSAPAGMVDAGTVLYEVRVPAVSTDQSGRAAGAASARGLIVGIRPTSGNIGGQGSARALLGSTLIQEVRVNFLRFALAARIPGVNSIDGNPSQFAPLVYNNLLDRFDQPTGWSISSVSSANWRPYSDTTASNDTVSGVTGGNYLGSLLPAIPASVYQSIWFQYATLGTESPAVYDPAKPQFKISGLNPDKYYTIKMTGSDGSYAFTNASRYRIMGAYLTGTQDYSGENILNLTGGVTFNVKPSGEGNLFIWMNFPGGFTDAVACIAAMTIFENPPTGNLFGVADGKSSANAFGHLSILGRTAGQASVRGQMYTKTAARWNFTKTAFAVANNNNMIAGAFAVGALSQEDGPTGWRLITNAGEWETYLGSFQAINNGEGGSSGGAPVYTTFNANELQGAFLNAGHSVNNGGLYPFEFNNLPAGTYNLYMIGSIKSSINANVPNGVFRVKFGAAAFTSQTIAQQSDYTTPALIFTGTIGVGEKIEFGPFTLTEANGDTALMNALLIEKVDPVTARVAGAASAVGTLGVVSSATAIDGRAAGASTAVCNLGGLILDLYPGAKASYGLRKQRTGYNGYAIRIRRSSDDTEQDIGFNGNDLDTAAISSFVGANSAYVKTQYDQSGSGFDLTQATFALQPRIVNAGTLDTDPASGRPMMFHALSRYLERTNVALGKNVSHLWSFCYARTAASIGSGRENTFGISNGLATTGSRLNIGKPTSVSTMAIVGRRDDAGASVTMFDTTPLTNSTNFLLTTANKYATTEAWTYYNGVAGAYSSAFSDAGVTSNTDALSFCVGAQQGALSFWGGHIGELYIYETDQVSTRAGIETNIINYFAATASSAINGIATGVAQVIGLLAASGLATGRIAGAATSNGTMSATGLATGVTAAMASVRATLGGLAIVAGNTTAQGAARATIAATGAALGTAAGSAQVRSTLAATGTATAVAAGQAQVRSTLQATGTLTAVAAGQAAVYTPVTAFGQLTAITVGSATARGTLNAAASGDNLLSVTGGQAQAWADLIGQGVLSGRTGGAALASAGLVATGSLSGNDSGAATVRAFLLGTAPVSAQTDARATARASIISTGTLSGRTGGSTVMRATLGLYIPAYPYSQYFWSN